MLTQLSIQNFGLIDDLTIEFSDRLTVLTGETGAGKSIIIDALRYVLGERLDPAQVRSKTARCAVEAVFRLAKGDARSSGAFDEYLSPDDPTVIIHRSCHPDGKTKIRLNGAALTVAQLKALGDLLVDFHGPNDHQLLLDASSHRGILDRLCEGGGRFVKYAALFDAYAAVKARLADVRESAASRDRDLETLAHQIKELERVKLDRAAYETARDEQKRLDNVERLYERTAELIALLADEEPGTGEKIAQAFGPMRSLVALDPSAAAFGAALEKLQESHAELLAGLERYLGGLSFEPEEAAAVRERSDLYDAIIRRYGPTIDDAAAFYRKAVERHAFLADLEHSDGALAKELAAAEKALATEADKITKARQKAAAALKATIEKELRELGIERVVFEARIERSDFTREGRDAVTFYISPNAGEELKPLAAIVSSGEAARVMLALKKALIKVDPIPTLIFDEIDAQIGGRLGTVTGTKVRELSRERQVILITHLPQIASFADMHYKVTKAVQKGRTMTSVRLLEGDERVKELAQMMSGSKETAVARAHAEEMVAKAGEK